MARPLRICPPGSFHHVMARGNAKMVVFLDDRDRRHFLHLAGEALARLEVTCLAYCLMPNHYHLLLRVLRPEDLSRAMRQVNGVYAQWWNVRHDRVGHVFQGRFKAQLVQNDRYLARLCAYIAWNPVRAALAARPGEWPWSSYGVLSGAGHAPAWFDLARVLPFLTATGAPRELQAIVEAGGDDPEMSSALRSDARVIGDQAFVASLQPVLQLGHPTEVTARERNGGRPALSQLVTRQQAPGARNRAIQIAVEEHRYSQAEIASHLDLHYSTVCNILRRLRSPGTEPPVRVGERRWRAAARARTGASPEGSGVDQPAAVGGDTVQDKGKIKDLTPKLAWDSEPKCQEERPDPS